MNRGDDRHVDTLCLRQGRRQSPRWRRLRRRRWPRPGLRATLRLRRAPGRRRNCATARLEQVSSRSPRPDRPVSVSGRAPSFWPKRISSAKPRVVRAARALSPSFRPSEMPQAMASTFLSAPPISTPQHIVGAVDAEGGRLSASPIPRPRRASARPASPRSAGRSTTSPAKLGPESTMARPAAARSATTSFMNRPVRCSMPLAQMMIGAGRCLRGRARAARSATPAAGLRRHRRG